VADDVPQAGGPLWPVAIGEIVAHKYRVERVVGVGAMGVVVSARHTTLDQIVAIKFLAKTGTFSSREEAIARFLAEARAAARIESDHVCRVFDVGTQPDGTPYMVMEYLEGRDLEEELQTRGQLQLIEAADCVLQAADAIAAAHALGIVHRDLKPANLFLATRPDGSRRVKVLDFGISKAGGARITKEAGSLGTPAYMSPEQVQDPMHVDHRTDIWALGAILYELVTGEMAFVGEDVKTILDRVMAHDPCPMGALRRDVPPELESIVMRCLDRDRERRWRSAALLARSLAPFGSIGIMGQLASVQREIGSLPSVRASAAPSVEPMVANVRPHIITQPDPEEERSARGNIVGDWSRQQTRRRRFRAIAIGLMAALLVSGTAAIVISMAARRGLLSGTKASAVEAPPPAASLASPASEGASAVAPPPLPAEASTDKNVQSTPSSVHSARMPPAHKGPSNAKPAGKTSPKGSVDRLTETRD